MSGSPLPHGPSARILRWLGGAGVAAAGAWVFRHALAQFFSADDFYWLARAAGLLPHLHSPWRYLSGEIYFFALWPLAGLHPWAYHAASLLMHLAGALLLYRLLLRTLSAPAAFAGAIAFVTHPAHVTATYWISAVGSPMALLLSLLATFAALRRDRARWLAVPLFAAAILARESVMFLPLALAVLLDWDTRRAPESGGHGAARSAAHGTTARAMRSWHDPLLITLAGLSLAEIVFMLGSRVMGPATGTAPYALSAGRGLVRGALTYLGWTVNFLLPTVRSYQDAIEPQAYAWGVGALALWLAGLASPGLRRRGWLAAGAFYAAMLLPVLPVTHHTYHYYLCPSLIGFGWCVGAALDWALERATVQRERRPTRTRAVPAAAASANAPLAWSLSLAIAFALIVNATLLVSKIESMPFMDTSLHADTTVDRGLIAERAITSLRHADLAPHTRLLFWSPLARGPAGAQENRESYFETNVRTALFDGLAARLFFRQIDSVGFVREYASLPARYRWAVYRPDGVLRVSTSAEIDSSLAAFRRDSTASATASPAPSARPIQP
jgi:hypothetical protein